MPTPQRTSPAENAPSAHSVSGPALDPMAEPLLFAQQNIRAVSQVIAQLKDLLPPQIDEEEVVAHLVLRLADGAYEESARRDPTGWLWQQALAYLRSHPVIQAAARCLQISSAEPLTQDQLRQIALALTIFGQWWLPDGEEGDAEILAHAMARLSTEERLALAMFFFDGLSLPEIARELDMPPDEVSALYSAAIKHLRQEIAIIALDPAQCPDLDEIPPA